MVDISLLRFLDSDVCHDGRGHYYKLDEVAKTLCRMTWDEELMVLMRADE